MFLSYPDMSRTRTLAVSPKTEGIIYSRSRQWVFVRRNGYNFEGFSNKQSMTDRSNFRVGKCGRKNTRG